MPLTALIDADAYASQVFVDFIRRYGFDEGHPGKNPDYGKLRMVTFTYSRADESGQPQVYQIEVPMLLLIPLPALSIRDAQIDFGVQVFGAVESPVPDNSDAANQGGQPMLPVSPRPRQLRVRMARAPRVTTTNDVIKEEVSSRVDMKVRVNVDQSDLPEGILQLLNLTAQSTTDRRLDIPYITITPKDGKTILTSREDTIELTLLLREVDGAPIVDKQIMLRQDFEHLFVLPDRPLITDSKGEAKAIVRLERTPERSPLLKTITAIAVVHTERYDSVDATGSIRVEVDLRESEAGQ